LVASVEPDRSQQTLKAEEEPVSSGSQAGKAGEVRARLLICALLSTAFICAFVVGSLWIGTSSEVTKHVSKQSTGRFLQASSSITAEMQEVLDKHNVYRCMHGVPLLTWDADIAASAQAWADNGVWAHSPKPRLVNGEKVGENLAFGSPTRTGTHSTISWYSEIQYTSPYGLADSTSDSVDPDETVGHYTAIVWKSTTKLGCGTARMVLNGNEGDIWVCQYGNSRGNTNGLFAENVLAPSETVTECGGTSSDVPSHAVTTMAATTTVVVTVTSTLATTTGTTTTTALATTSAPLCAYASFSNTAVKKQGTGGSKLKRASYSSDAAYLNACQANCNADMRCGGFVDDPTDRRGRMCKPKTASEGYSKASKTFYRKGSGC
jgi:uncharacterized protein YkwD